MSWMGGEYGGGGVVFRGGAVQADTAGAEITTGSGALVSIIIKERSAVQQ